MSKKAPTTRGGSAPPEQPSSQIQQQQILLLQKLWTSYSQTTPQRLKLVDAWLIFVMLTGVIQFVYVILAGTYPYNAFLSGFCASVGSFVLAANLRIQSNPKNAEEFGNQSPERSFADFVFLSIVLYGFVINFIG
ncbi:dolichyl-diphosphooligosaccharide---protein glycotransferase [Synchytrium microbalum]|uniref:Dolichyl-diphosphooligosaccharide--protein glycosyltransferase subunit OST2 n=1 Tax=Synchytrium microbalum TaxID=1806994 RepID=A0A507BQQ2_9FUNG|nr:dolichyl-diphosphooligosaccharide---protein glycotransferase [Synchytrium microbalum]TPX30152.1 dolichyl-diphosphooligosaccharide---protein glycotransferase [Synchytrium microbalum]